MAARHPNGPKPSRLTVGRIGLYVFLIVSALFFLLPLYTMVVTSLKTMEEIRQGRIFDESPWPEFLRKLVLLNQLARMLYQKK